MRKYYYISFFILISTINVVYANFLDGMPDAISEDNIYAVDTAFRHLRWLGAEAEGLDSGVYEGDPAKTLEYKISDTDISIMRKLVHLEKPAAELDPYESIISQASGLLGGIERITPEEINLWGSLYLLLHLDMGWKVLPSEGSGSAAGMTDFESTFAELNQKIGAYRLVRTRASALAGRAKSTGKEDEIRPGCVT